MTLRNGMVFHSYERNTYNTLKYKKRSHDVCGFIKIQIFWM
jgi:hypothetical protein